MLTLFLAGAWALGGLGTGGFKPLHPADVFSVRVSSAGGGITTRVFSKRAPADHSLSWWNWGMTPWEGIAALFPKVAYQTGALPVQLKAVEFSPVIRGNSKVSSYPVVITRWHAANKTAEKQTVTILLTWENHAPGAAKSNEYREEKLAQGAMKGILQSGGPLALTVLESAGQTVSYHARFNPTGDGGTIWQPFVIHGELTNQNEKMPVGADERIASALAVTFALDPGAEADVPFAIAWKTEAWAVAREALQKHQEWEEQVVAWHRPILDDSRTPKWYKEELLSSLSKLVDRSAPDSKAVHMLFPDIAKDKPARGVFDNVAKLLEEGKTTEAWRLAEEIRRNEHPDALGLWAIQDILERLWRKSR